MSLAKTNACSAAPLINISDISTSCPFDFPFRIVTSMIFGNNFLTANLVLLYNRGRLRNRIIDHPILSDNVVSL